MDKRGQVWVETVIYTLIGFSIIGLVLAFAKPKIEEIQDRLIIEQSMEVMKEIDNTIAEISREGIGNQRILDIKVGKGNLQIDGQNNKIIFEIDSRSIYSELDLDIQEGSLIIRTDKKGKFNTVTLTLNYGDDNGGLYDITYNDQDEIRKLTKSAAPYAVIISNKVAGKIDMVLG